MISGILAGDPGFPQCSLLLLLAFCIGPLFVSCVLFGLFLFWMAIQRMVLDFCSLVVLPFLWDCSMDCGQVHNRSLLGLSNQDGRFFFRPSSLRLSPGRHTVFVLMNELGHGGHA